MSELNKCDYCGTVFNYDGIKYRCHDCDAIIDTDDDGNCELCGSYNVHFICPECENSDYTYKLID